MRHASGRAPSGGRLLGNLLALALIGWASVYAIGWLTGWWSGAAVIGCWAGGLSLSLVRSGIGVAVTTVALLVWALSRFRSTAALGVVIAALVGSALLEGAAVQLLQGCP